VNVLTKAAVALAGVSAALVLAGCGDKVQVEGAAQPTTKRFFSSPQVRMAFLIQGIQLRPSQYLNAGALTYDSPVAGPYFEVRLYRGSVTSATVDSVVVDPGKHAPAIKWVERRNVWVRYDRNRAVIRRKITAALDSLSRA